MTFRNRCGNEMRPTRVSSPARKISLRGRLLLQAAIVQPLAAVVTLPLKARRDHDGRTQA